MDNTDHTKGRTLMRRFLILTLALCLLLGQTGCLFIAGGSAGAGAAVWYKGRLTEEINKNVDQVYNASVSAIRQMGLSVLKAEQHETSAKVHSKYLDDTNIWIDIQAIEKDLSRIVIRVGILGDEHRARNILGSIKKSL